MTTIYLDLETAGLQPEHPTIQLAAVAMDDGQEIDAFEQKIAFDVARADPEALALNGYTAEKWAESVSQTVALAKFDAWIRHYCFIERISKTGTPYRIARAAGYNVTTFDGPRLRALYGAQFCPIEFLMRDVLQRVLWFFDEYPFVRPPADFKLSTVAAHLGLPTDGAHDALADARMAAAVARRIGEMW